MYLEEAGWLATQVPLTSCESLSGEEGAAAGGRDLQSGKRQEGEEGRRN